MEELCSPLSATYFYQDEGIEELRHCLLYITELETTIFSAKEEITRREFEIVNLKDLLNKTTKERNEAQEESQKLLLEKIILQQQLLQKQPQILQYQQQNEQEQEMQQIKQETTPPPPPPPAVTVVEATYSSEHESKACDRQVESPFPEVILKLAAERPLPEKGKLLQAVKEAGPLLQTLLLAGPLPQWQHPPPQLDSIDIPPVTISSFNASFSKKRGHDFCQSPDSSSSPIIKYQKISFF